MKDKNDSYSSAFTLVELMVVISIFLLISGVTLFNYSDFRSNVSLQNITDDIALSIRKAQSFAIGARGNDAGGSVSFSKSYGIHFAKDSTPTSSFFGSDKSFLIFSTSTPKEGYNENESVCDGNGECMEVFNIKSLDVIKDIDLDKGHTHIQEKASLDIIFTRPEPRAYFCFRVSPNANCSTTDYSEVHIVVSNGLSGSKEKTKTISVQNTGQISVQ